MRLAPISLIASLTALLTLGCVVEAPAPEALGAADSALEQGRMIVYRSGTRVADADLTDLGSPGALGGTVLDGDPHIAARIDYAEGGRLGGVFQATRGTVLIHFPFTEHATITYGEVALTDADGQHHLFKPGDSYFIKQGSDILWEVSGDRVQKSFFSQVEPADAPGPMIVYKKGSIAGDDTLTDLGPPDALGGTVLSGDPHIAARVDHAGAGLLGGVFQATRGDVMIHFPFTEHATITRGEVTLTDEAGLRHTLHPGDTYLIPQASNIRWEVSGPRVQKSFLNFTAQ